MTPPHWLKTDVSRETLDHLGAYVSLIEKWNQRINLVSKNSLEDLWDRHIWDQKRIVQIKNFTSLKAINANAPFCAPRSESWN